MIKIYLGNVGSGKTVSAVREIIKDNKITYSNIKVHSDNNKFITKNELFTNLTYDKHNNLITRALKLNIDYWKAIKEDINVVIDEAHTLFNSRRSMTKINILLTEWVALIRRVLGNNPNSEGDLVLISQLWFRLDSITRDMAHQIKHHTCYNRKKCLNCGIEWVESSEDYEKLKECPDCEGRDFKKYDFKIEVKVFNSMDNFITFNQTNQKTYFNRYIIEDIEHYFKFYNTLQWDNLISDL